MNPFDAWFLAQRWMAVLTVALLFLAVTMFCGCSVIPRPQRGGSATVAPQQQAGNAGSTQNLPMGGTITQPDNPNGSSTQETSFEKTTETLIPAPSTTVTTTTFPDGRKIEVKEERPAGTVVTESVKQGIKQEISGSWKDTARELGVKLAAGRPVQYAGIGLILFGAAGLFYAPLRVVLGGGKQFPIACAVVGLVLIVLPSVVVGNERLILAGVFVLGFVYWLSIRVTRHETMVDLNKNGIDDRKESPAPPPT